MALVLAAVALSSCGDDEKATPVRTFNMGDRVTLGHLVYTVYETQWLTQLGEPPMARVPQSRFLLIRLSAANGGANTVTIPNFILEDDNGTTYPELSNGEGVSQYIGYLRRVKPAESAQGHALFDAPPRHYKLRVMDEDSERAALIDIPLSFTSESPDVPQAGNDKPTLPQAVPSKKR